MTVGDTTGHAPHPGEASAATGLAAHAWRLPTWRRTFAIGSGAVEIVCHRIVTPRWTAAPFGIAAIADPHVIWPWMSLSALRRIARLVDTLPVHMVALLGDYVAASPTPGRPATPDQVAAALAEFHAPYGIHAVLGNHDWRDDPLAKSTDFRVTSVARALAAQGIHGLDNQARRLAHEGDDVWAVGFDSQRGHLPMDAGGARHDPEAAFAEMPDGAPAVLLAHEPDYFKYADPRPVVQLSGHTHGGQVNLFGWRPFTPPSHAHRYVYGHVAEAGRHLVVSGGLGFTHVPLRFRQPPEITLVELVHPDDARGA